MKKNILELQAEAASKFPGRHNLVTLFTQLADQKFGPAPDPNIPQTMRYQSYFEFFLEAVVFVEQNRLIPVGEAIDRKKRTGRYDEEVQAGPDTAGSHLIGD